MNTPALKLADIQAACAAIEAMPEPVIPPGSTLLAEPATADRLRAALLDRGFLSSVFVRDLQIDAGTVLVLKPMAFDMPYATPMDLALEPPRMDYAVTSRCWSKPLTIPLVSWPVFDWPEPRKLGKADQRRARVRQALAARRAWRRVPVKQQAARRAERWEAWLS